ncbi:uncharacterized protein [Medicago truncatula]|uniref:uncharacterized protein isoform X2 n=1 Tax=Medicago truncatula TaxID=3880 RepID=UPI001967BFDB|nr:uncharacterized protein LOC11411182 isoform X2 [Medicago truncatula]
MHHCHITFNEALGLYHLKSQMVMNSTVSMLNAKVVVLVVSLCSLVSRFGASLTLTHWEMLKMKLRKIELEQCNACKWVKLKRKLRKIELKHASLSHHFQRGFGALPSQITNGDEFHGFNVKFKVS